MELIKTMSTFEELHINKSFLKALKEAGLTEPTPIQEKAIPRIRSGNDVLGIAQTGTGKTEAYLLPLLSKLVKAEGSDPRALILVPTRELSIQVGERIKRLTLYNNIRHAAVYGGTGWTKQAALIDSGIDILVATPGMLLDLYSRDFLVLKKVKTLVIDEVDRMLDMGFIPQIRRITGLLQAKRQNLFFSATLTERVDNMSKEFLALPDRVEVSLSASTPEEVEQYFYKVPNTRTKLNLLAFLLRDEELFDRVIIFVRTKENAEQIFKVVSRKTEGDKRVIHSNKGQSTRINAIRDFKEGKVRILVTTDVCARGLDIPLVSHVINFNPPVEYENYVHRIGRTARAHHKGIAITFADPSEEYSMHKIAEMIRMDIPEKDFPQEVEIVASSHKENESQLRAIDHQRRMENPEFRGAFQKKKKIKRANAAFAARKKKNVKRIHKRNKK